MASLYVEAILGTVSICDSSRGLRASCLGLGRQNRRGATKSRELEANPAA